jgi:hypothetical protein
MRLSASRTVSTATTSKSSLLSLLYKIDQTELSVARRMKGQRDLAMSEMSRELPNKNQPRPQTFKELICAMDQALKARAKHLDTLEIEFQTSVVYSDHRW